MDFPDFIGVMSVDCVDAGSKTMKFPEIQLVDVFFGEEIRGFAVKKIVAGETLNLTKGAIQCCDRIITV